MITVETRRVFLTSGKKPCSTSLKIYAGLNIRSPAVSSDLCGEKHKVSTFYVPTRVANQLYFVLHVLNFRLVIMGITNNIPHSYNICKIRMGAYY